METTAENTPTHKPDENLPSKWSACLSTFIQIKMHNVEQKDMEASVHECCGFLLIEGNATFENYKTMLLCLNSLVWLIRDIAAISRPMGVCGLVANSNGCASDRFHDNKNMQMERSYIYLGFVVHRFVCFCPLSLPSFAGFRCFSALCFTTSAIYYKHHGHVFPLWFETDYGSKLLVNSLIHKVQWMFFRLTFYLFEWKMIWIELCVFLPI